MKSTVMENMENTVRQHGCAIALKEKSDGRWQETTWNEYYRQVRMTARGFMAAGLERGRGVCILGENSKKWFISNLGGIFAGGIPTGIYSTNSPEQCQHVAGNSRANIIVVENKTQLAKIKHIKQNLPDLKAIFLMKGQDHDEDVYAWEDLQVLGEKISEEELNRQIQAQHPDDCCTLIYTSGTTGNPKGVMISHDNITWTSSQLIKTINGNHTDQIISYLPLSHIAEQVISLHAPVIMAATTWFAESMELLGENIKEVRPTIFVGVPRVWEKIQTKIVAAGSQNSWLKKRIAVLARKQGLKAGYAIQDGKPKPLLYTFFDKLVFSKVKEKLGLDRCRLFVSTAAPVSIDTLEFFIGLGLPVTEVYGMSECTGPAVVSLPEPFKYRIGWAGPALSGTELSLTDDGEILIRGRHVCKGYLGNDDATKKTIDTDGWLHSGDVGKMDDNGFLKVIDRKKELIITSGGENISPQVLEGMLKAIPVISQVVVIGDRRKYLTALITLDNEKIEKEAKTAGSPAQNAESAAKCEKFNTYIRNQINEVNKALARVQTIKKFIILPENFSIEGGELTHTMKIKRKIIHEKYEKQIDSMYA
ncbi:MAG: AMP-binding protein [Proteobacteria bacterium]|nr:AMP-binding protein [Pseudomonadota bacterium]